MKRWTAARLGAAITAITSMLAGEEGEGDSEGIAFEDLEAALERLQQERERLEQPAGRVPRPSKRALKGLSEIYRLAYADVECSEPDDFGAARRRELDDGFEFIADLLNWNHRSVR